MQLNTLVAYTIQVRCSISCRTLVSSWWLSSRIAEPLSSSSRLTTDSQTPLSSPAQLQTLPLRLEPSLPTNKLALPIFSTSMPCTSSTQTFKMPGIPPMLQSQQMELQPHNQEPILTGSHLVAFSSTTCSQSWATRPPTLTLASSPSERSGVRNGERRSDVDRFPDLFHYFLYLV